MDAWGLTGTPVPLPGGHRNTVLRVGDHVLKTTRRSEAAMEWLLPVAGLAANCGLNMPSPIRATSGVIVVEGWTCELFCPGTPTSPTDIADRMVSFHHVAAGMPQRDGFLSARALLANATGGDIDLSVMPPDLVSKLRAAWTHLPDTQTAIHSDLNARNILTANDGTVTLIDWDEARRDAPLFDTATWSGTPDSRAALAWEVASCWQIEPARARQLAQLFSD